MRPDPRRGALLLVVAGACAILAALATAFLLGTREEAAETGRVVGEAQARIMLMAACNYVQEASRLGYDVDPHAGAGPHVEAFGWIDVRDGASGPRDAARRPLFSTAAVESWRAATPPDRPAWPAVGGVTRCPMAVRERPPYAVQPTVVYNPIGADGMPYLREPDPQPAVANGWPADPTGAGFAEFVRGEPRLRATSTGRGWFRVLREGDAVFVVTCGSGASLGWRDWDEMPAAARDAFAGDPGAFAAAVADECRLWYRLEWSAAVPSADSCSIENEAWRSGPDPAVLHPMNLSQCSAGRSQRSMTRCPNLVGTIRWIERLATPPTRW